MSIFSMFKSRGKQRVEIVTRLLTNGSINPEEAALLLETTTHIRVGKLDISSGAKVVAGDNTDYR